MIGSHKPIEGPVDLELKKAFTRIDYPTTTHQSVAISRSHSMPSVPSLGRTEQIPNNSPALLRQGSAHCVFSGGHHKFFDEFAH